MKAALSAESEFRKANLFAKDDVLASFRTYMEYLGEGEVVGLSHGISRRRIDLCREFLEKVEACWLPYLTDPWRFYEYLVAEDRIELNLCTASQVKFDKKRRLSWSTTVEQTLIRQECRLLTVEEFARIWDVTPATVRQWIRRGKLRTARKVGREWLIPELQEKPETVYRPAYYLISQQELLKIPGFPLVSVCDTITISQDRNDKKSFVVDLRNSQSGFRQSMVLSKKEVEAFEYALILSGKTTQGAYGHLIFGL